MTIAKAIDDFRVAADAKAEFATPASRDQSLHARMAQSFHFLMSFGADGRAAFANLLDDPSPHVRGWVAAQLLADGDLSALPVLEQLANNPGIGRFDAEVTLKEFHAGQLGSPFPRDGT